MCFFWGGRGLPLLQREGEGELAGEELTKGGTEREGEILECKMNK